MDFTPNDVQREIYNLTDQVLDKERDHRQIEVDPHIGHDAPAWATLAEPRLRSLALPTRLGGAELGIAEVSAVRHQRAPLTPERWLTLTHHGILGWRNL
ncbi:hypothetical protein [Rhodococcus oryzae]|uniref:hypothetical protein n=1 Tax=Rhodococcus oryzae TaxID=2571143 RepID=UPI0037A9010D